MGLSLTSMQPFSYYRLLNLEAIPHMVFLVLLKIGAYGLTEL